MLSEEGRRYKISLQPLGLRNSEPKYVERLKGKGRGTGREKRKAKRKKEILQEASWERSLCRGSSASHLPKEEKVGSA